MNDYKKKYLKYKLKYLNLKNKSKIHNNLIKKHKSKLKLIKGGTIEELQNYLNKNNLNLKVVNVPGDGNCQFHAIIHQLNLKKKNNEKLNNFSLREKTAQWLKKHPDWYLLDDGGGDGTLFTVKQTVLNDKFMLKNNRINTNANPDEQWEEYIKKIEENKCWGDGYTITAVSILLNINIILYSDHIPKKLVFTSPDSNKNTPTIHIGYVNYNHYVSLVPKEENINEEDINEEDYKEEDINEEDYKEEDYKKKDLKVKTEINNSMNVIGIGLLAATLLILFSIIK